MKELTITLNAELTFHELFEEELIGEVLDKGYKDKFEKMMKYDLQADDLHVSDFKVFVRDVDEEEIEDHDHEDEDD